VSEADDLLRHQENQMKQPNKKNKKLSLNATTVRVLQASLREVVGGMGPNTAFVACHSQENCGESHAPTCGDGSRCA
jgi:hypothetical protein